ncbi:MAG: autotransporter outer membrane beta-barrel domain-containing protein [Gammaproteobacteria bacterium]|nr:autotransporter outer membrane beta-barrel domain-containing protein [Gammaproteobacteria bacterium]
MRLRNCVWTAAVLLAISISHSDAQQAEESSVRFRQCRVDNLGDCLNGVATGVSTPDSVRSLSNRTARTLRRETQEDTALALHGGAVQSTVLAAGDGPGFTQLWSNYNHVDQRSDFVNARNESLGFDSSLNSGIVGAHRLFAERWLLGAAIGYDDMSISTAFNGGKSNAEAIMVTPYIAWLVSDHISIDASYGYTWLDYEQHRIAPDNGSPIDSTFDGARWFLSANLAGAWQVNEWQLGARIGYLYVRETHDAYVEQTRAGSPVSTRLWTVDQRRVTLSQINFGADIARTFEKFEPFAYAVYRNDLSRSEGQDAGGLPEDLGAVRSADDDEFELGFGLRMRGESAWSSAVEFSRIFSRTDYASWTAGATLRYDF